MMKNEKVAGIIVNRYKKAKHKASMTILGFVIFIILGYTIFFTSNIWYPESGDLVKPSEYNVIRNWNDREVTLLSWEYSKYQKEMELLLTIKNQSFDGINEYDVTAVERNKGALDTSIFLQEKDLYVVRISNVPEGWSQVSFRLCMDGADPLKLYTNKNAVTMTDDIQDLTYYGYMTERQEVLIAGYEDKISEWNTAIAEEQKTIDNCNADINEWTAAEEYQTDYEKAETEQLIAKAKSQISMSETNIKNYQDNIAEYEERIKNAQAQINQYKQGE